MTKELEALEKIKEYLTRYNDTDDIRGIDYENEVNVLEKSLKALEIIKNKKIDVVLFNDCPDLDEYNEWASDKSQLNKEQYDLLKEVLKK